MFENIGIKESSIIKEFFDFDELKKTTNCVCSVHNHYKRTVRNLVLSSCERKEYKLYSRHAFFLHAQHSFSHYTHS